MTSTHQNTQRAILNMITAVFMFSLMDVMGKFIGENTNTVMAIWARYMGQATIVLLIFAPRIKSVARTKYPKLQLLRSVLLLIGTACYFFGVVKIGLAETAAIFDINPVLVTLAAAVILGESLGIRRIFGIVTCLLGALIIIRPGTDVFSPYMLLPLCAAFSYTGYAIATRFVGRDEQTSTSLFYTAAFGAIILSCIVPFYWQTPAPWIVALMVAIGGLGTIGHFFLIRAFTMTEASILAPFVYIGLIFSIIWGIILFGEYPDALTYVGAFVIVAAGIYVWHRETQARAKSALGET